MQKCLDVLLLDVIIILLKRTDIKVLAFFGIPKDGSLKRRCVQNIKSENLPKDPKVWHLDLEKSCFKRDLQVSFILVITY